MNDINLTDGHLKQYIYTSWWRSMVRTTVSGKRAIPSREQTCVHRSLPPFRQTRRKKYKRSLVDRLITPPPPFNLAGVYIFSFFLEGESIRLIDVEKYRI